MRVWTYSQAVDISQMQEIIKTMREFLEDFDTGHASSDVFAYCESLVLGQRDSLGRTIPGSWSVAPNDDNMPTDARVEFVFEPTYIAVAILSRSLLEYPWVAISIDGFKQALTTGMEFCTHRNLHGSGYDALDGLFNAWSILCAGHVPMLTKVAPEFSKKLSKIITKTELFLLDSLKTGNTTGPWGEDLKYKFEAAIETYYLLKDQELVSLVKSSSLQDFSNEVPKWIGS